MFQDITNNDDEECCSICLETINKNKNKVITNCGHTFHCICLIKNVSINGFACPYCRTNITEEENTDEDISIEDFSYVEDLTTELNLANDAILIDNMNSVVLENEIYTNEARRRNQIEYEENIINEYVNEININNYMERILSYHESRQNRLQPYTRRVLNDRQPQSELELELERQSSGLRPDSSIEQYRQQQTEMENQQIIASQPAEQQQIFPLSIYASSFEQHILNNQATMAASIRTRLEEPLRIPLRQLIIEQGIQSALRTGNIQPRRNIRNNNRFQVLSYLRNI
jgi:hypothetical protein